MCIIPCSIKLFSFLLQKIRHWLCCILELSSAAYDTTGAYNRLFILLPYNNLNNADGSLVPARAHLLTRAAFLPAAHEHSRQKVLARHLQVTVILLRAEFYIPCGLYVVRLTVFLVSFEVRLFLNIAFEIMYSLPECMENVGFPSFAELSSEVAQPSLMLPSASIPLACGSFELPSCARCFLGFSCQSHMKDLQWVQWSISNHQNTTFLNFPSLYYEFNMKASK